MPDARAGCELGLLLRLSARRTLYFGWKAEASGEEPDREDELEHPAGNDGGEPDAVRDCGDVAQTPERPAESEASYWEPALLSISRPSAIVRTISLDSSRYHVPFSN
jgi:hypothetical protein